MAIIEEVIMSSKKNTSLWIDEDVKTRLKDHCKRKGVSLEKGIQNILERFLPTEEYNSILLSIPKNLGKEELKTWLQQRSDYLINKLSK
jgi:hypothetical protein